MNKFRFLFIYLLAVLSLGKVYAQSEDSNTNPELLTNEFFHEENDTKTLPKGWNLSGSGATSETFQGAGVFRNSGYAVRIRTGNEKATFYQEVDLSKHASTITLGKDLEGLIHYSVDEGDLKKGSLRLAMKWLDRSGREIASHQDKDFVDNPDLLFSHFKSYGTLWFRMAKPEGAEKVKFAIEIEPNTVARFDDFSLKLQDSQEPFIAVLPQTLRDFQTKINVPVSQKVYVQKRYFPSNGEVKLPAGVNGSIKVDNSTLPKDKKVDEVTVTFNPTAPTKIPRGYATAPSLTFGVTGLTKRVSFTAAAIDPNKPPKVIIDPASFENIKAEVGETVKKEITVSAPDAIDAIGIALEPKGKGFAINASSIYYFTSPRGNLKAGINPTKIIVTFVAKEPGVVEGKLIFKSTMMETFEYPIRAEVTKSENKEEKFSKEKPVTDKRYPAWTSGEYHHLDMGLWKWAENNKKIFYDAESRNLTIYGKNSIEFVGSFVPGLVYNHDFPHGIDNISIYYANNADKTKLGIDISTDGGATWVRKDSKLAKGTGIAKFDIKTNQPTLFRIAVDADGEVADGELYAILEKIKVVPAKPEGRNSTTDIKELIDLQSQAAKALIFNEFNDVPHHLNFQEEGWTNLSINTSRPAVSFDERENDINSNIVETTAKLTLFRAEKFDKSKEMSILLASPVLSYTDAVKKELGFRLKRTIQNEGDSFNIYIAKLTNGKIAQEGDIMSVPYEKLLPNEKIVDNFWFDYLLNLEKYELNNVDKFIVIFEMKTVNEGDNSSTSYYIDDFSWGRANNPSVAVDKKELNFYQITDSETEPQTFKVTTQNATSSVVLKLFGQESAFKLKNSENTVISNDKGEATISKDGADVNVTVKTRANRDISSILYVATRGGEPITVRLFASRKSKDEVDGGDNNGSNDNGGNNNGGDNNGDGYDDGDDTIGGDTTPVDNVDKYDSYAYRQGNTITVVSENAALVELYDLSGKIIASKKGNSEITFTSVSSNVLIVRVLTNEGKSISFKL